MAFTLDPLYERQSWLDTQRHVYLLIGFSVASHMILLTTTVISIMAVVLDVGFVVLGFMVHQQIFHITQQSDYQNVALPRQTKDAMYTAFVLRCLRDLIIANIALLNLGGLHLMVASGQINIVTISVILCASVYWRYTKWVSDCQRVDDGDDFIERIKQAPANHQELVSIKPQKSGFNECFRHLAILSSKSEVQDTAIIAKQFCTFLEVIVSTLPNLWTSEIKKLLELALDSPCFLWCLQERSVNTMDHKDLLAKIVSASRKYESLKLWQRLDTFEYYALDQHANKIKFIHDNFIGDIVDTTTLTRYFLSCDVSDENALVSISYKWHELNDFAQSKVIINVSNNLNNKCTHHIRSAFSSANVERLYVLLLISPYVDDEIKLRALHSMMKYGFKIKSYQPELSSMMMQVLTKIDKEILRKSEAFSNIVSDLFIESLTGHWFTGSMTNPNTLKHDDINARSSHQSLDLIFDVLEDHDQLELFIEQHDCFYEYLQWQTQREVHSINISQPWLIEQIKQSLLRRNRPWIIEMLPRLIDLLAHQPDQSSFVHLLTLFIESEQSSTIDLINQYLAIYDAMNEEDHQWVKKYVLDHTVQLNLQQLSPDIILSLINAGGFNPHHIHWGDYIKGSKEYALTLMSQIIDQDDTGLGLIKASLNDLSDEHVKALCMSVGQNARTQLLNALNKPIKLRFCDWQNLNAAQTDSSVIRDAMIEYDSDWNDLDSNIQRLTIEDQKTVINHLTTRSTKVPFAYWDTLDQDHTENWFSKCHPSLSEEYQLLDHIFLEYVKNVNGLIPLKILEHATNVFIRNAKSQPENRSVIQSIFIQSSQICHSRITWLRSIPGHFWSALGDDLLIQSLLAPFINSEKQDSELHLFYITHINVLPPENLFILRNIELDKCDQRILIRINGFLQSELETQFPKVSEIRSYHQIQFAQHKPIQAQFSALDESIQKRQKKLNNRQKKGKRPSLKRFLPGSKK